MIQTRHPRARLGFTLAAIATGVAVTLSGCGAGHAPPPAAHVPAIAPIDSVTALVPQQLRDKGSLTVVMSVGTAPTKYLDPADGKTMLGFDPDLARALAATMGLDVDIVGGPLDQIIPGLQAGRYDMAVSQMGITPDRLKVLDFVEYFTSTSSLAVPQGNPKRLGFDTLCGAAVGGSTGSVQLTTYLPQVSKTCTEQGAPAVSIMEFADQQSAITAMRSGRIDAVFGDKPVVLYAASKDGAVELAADYTEARPVGIAAVHGSPLLPAVEEGLRQLIRSGVYQEILTKWGVEAGGIAEPRLRVET